MKTAGIILSLLPIMIFSSCSTTIDIHQYIDNSNALTLSVKKVDISTGLTQNEKTTIEPNTKKFKRIIDWCDDNQDGWEISFASYAPKVSVTQKDFTLLYTTNDVAIRFVDDKGKNQQYSKTIIEGELDFLFD